MEGHVSETLKHFNGCLMDSKSESPVNIGDENFIQNPVNRPLNYENNKTNGNTLSFRVLFNVINFLQSLLCLIKIKTEIVCQKTSCRSMVNFEKINLLNYVSLIDYYRSFLLTNLSDSNDNNSFHHKQLLHSYHEIENEIEFFTSDFIDNYEIQSNYSLSKEVINCLLDDCEIDMDDIEKILSNISKELQTCFTGSSISKRIQRSLQKKLDILSTDLLLRLDPIKLILESDRLFVSFNKISPINIRIQMVGVRQISLRNMILERILLLQSTLVSGRKPSFFDFQIHSDCSSGVNSKKWSVISIDSGFQFSDPGKTESYCDSDLNDVDDEDDVIPFYDEEYERIIVDDSDTNEDLEAAEIQEQPIDKNTSVPIEYTSTLRRNALETEFSNYLSNLISKKSMTNEADILEEMESFVWEQENNGFNEQKNNSAAGVTVTNWRLSNEKLDQNTNNNAGGESDEDSSILCTDYQSISSSTSSFVETQKHSTEMPTQIDVYNDDTRLSPSSSSSSLTSSKTNDIISDDLSQYTNHTNHTTNATTTTNATSCCCDCIVRYKTSCFDDNADRSMEMQQCIPSAQSKYGSDGALFLSNLSMTLRLVKLFIQIEYQSYNSSIRTLHSLSKEIGSNFVNLSELLADMKLMDEKDTNLFHQTNSEPIKVTNNTCCDTLKDLAEEIFVDTLRDMSEEQHFRQENRHNEIHELSVIFRSLHCLLVSTESQVSLLEALLTLITHHDSCYGNENNMDNSILTRIIHNARLCVVKRRIEIANQILGNMDVLLQDSYCSSDDSQLKLLNDFNYLYKEYSVLLDRIISFNFQNLYSQSVAQSSLSFNSSSSSSSLSSGLKNANGKDDNVSKFPITKKLSGKTYHEQDWLFFNELLPNDLLMKIEISSIDNDNDNDNDKKINEEIWTIEFSAIYEESKKRLIKTVRALKEYPCYGQLCKLIDCKPDDDVGKLESETNDLEKDLFILRRITAICAVNIVDLHDMVIKCAADEHEMHNTVSSHNAPRPSQNLLAYSNKIRQLISCWQQIDTECHRILRCTHLLHQINRDVTAAYSSMIALYAFLLSGLLKLYKEYRRQQVEQTGLNGVNLAMYTQHTGHATSLLLTLQCYKLRLLRWLEEVKLCSDVIRQKRITQRRYRYYLDIHQYLGENLTTLQQLSDRIIREQFLKDKSTIKNIKKLHKILRYLSRQISSVPTTQLDISALDICKKYSNQNPIENANIRLKKKPETTQKRAPSSTIYQQNSSIYSESDESSTATNHSSIIDNGKNNESFIWCEELKMEESHNASDEHVISAEIDIEDGAQNSTASLNSSSNQSSEPKVNNQQLKYQDSFESLSTSVTSVMKDQNSPIKIPQISEHSYTKILEYALQNILQQNSLEPTAIKNSTNLQSYERNSLVHISSDQIQEKIIQQLIEQSNESNTESLYKTNSLVHSTTNSIDELFKNRITDAMLCLLSDQILERLVAEINAEEQEVRNQSTDKLNLSIQECLIEKSINLLGDSIISSKIVDEISEDISEYLQQEVCVKIIMSFVEEIQMTDKLIVAKIAREISGPKEDNNSGLIEIDDISVDKVEENESVRQEVIAESEESNRTNTNNNKRNRRIIEEDDTEYMEDAEDLPTDTIHTKLSLNEEQEYQDFSDLISEHSTNTNKNWKEISEVMSEKIKYKIVKPRFSLARDVLLRNAVSSTSLSCKTAEYCQITNCNQNRGVSQTRSLRNWWRHKTGIPSASCRIIVTSNNKTPTPTSTTPTNKSSCIQQINCSSSSSISPSSNSPSFGCAGPGKVRQLVARFNDQKKKVPSPTPHYGRLTSGSPSCFVKVLPSKPFVKPSLSLATSTHDDMIHYDNVLLYDSILVTTHRDKVLANTKEIHTEIREDQDSKQISKVCDQQTVSFTNYSNTDDNVLSDIIMWGHLEDNETDDVFDDETDDTDDNENDDENQNYYLENTDSATISLSATTHHNISSIRSYSENFSNVTISTRSYDGYSSEIEDYDQVNVINQDSSNRNQAVLTENVIKTSDNLPIKISESIIDSDKKFDSNHHIQELNNNFSSNTVSYSVTNDYRADFDSIMVNKTKFGEQIKMSNYKSIEENDTNDYLTTNNVIVFLLLLLVTMVIIYMGIFLLIGDQYQTSFGFFKKRIIPKGLPT